MRTPASDVEYDVYIDTNGDGKADAILRNTRIPTPMSSSASSPTRSGNVIGHSVFPINDADGSIDTNVFDSDVMVLPVSIKALTSMSKKAQGGGIHYWVAAETLEGGLTDVARRPSSTSCTPASAWSRARG